MTIRFNSNLDELIAKFEKLGQQAGTLDFSDAFTLGVNAAKAAMQNRIFNQGRDVGGALIGDYKGNRSKTLAKAVSAKLKGDVRTRTIGARLKFTPYELKRIEAGRQVVYKDLEFEGSLRRGMITVTQGPRKVVCAIPNEQLFIISKGQEEQTGKKIFALSPKERDILVKNCLAGVKQKYDSLLKSSGTI